MTMTVHVRGADVAEPSWADLDQIRSMLLTLQRELETEILQVRATASVLCGDGDERAADDAGDSGCRMALRDQELTVLATVMTRLIQVERALHRLDVGTYGVCEGCGEPIPAARLEAFPAATECCRCKQLGERRR